MARTYYRSYNHSAVSSTNKIQIPDQLFLDMQEDLMGQKEKLDMLIARTGDDTSKSDPADTTELLSATMDGLLLLFGVSTVIANFQVASKLAPCIPKPKPKSKSKLKLNMRDASTQTDDDPQLIVPFGVGDVLEETEESPAQNQAAEDKSDENFEIGTQTEIETDNEKCSSHTPCPCHCHNHYFSGSQDEKDEDEDMKFIASTDSLTPQTVIDNKMTSLAATLLSPHILSEINQAIMLQI